MDYAYNHGNPTWDDSSIWQAIHRILAARPLTSLRAFDVGCGNGVMAGRLYDMGFAVCGIDPSVSGIEAAKKAHPNVRFEVHTAYDDLAALYGIFPLVISVEVIEHCVDPRLFAKRFYDLLEPGGVGIITTPYHGWLKNVAISVLGKWDSHHDVLWDGGHVKFFSAKTLSALLLETGFREITIDRIGRIPPLAKSMLASFIKPN